MSDMNVSKKLSTQEAFDLSSLAYLNLNVVQKQLEGYDKEFIKNIKGQSLREISNTILSYVNNGKFEVPFALPYNGGMAHTDFVSLLEKIAKPDNKLGNLIFKDYKYDNVTEIGKEFTGFVGMAFEDSENNTYFGFTGSEGAAEAALEGVPNPYISKDWIDNFNFIGRSSEQFKKIEDFVNKSIGNMAA
jgi:hypothetical protein